MKRLIFFSVLVLLSLKSCHGLCGNGIVEPGEDCDITQPWCSHCRFSTSVNAAITQQIETISGDPSLTVELVTILKYPFQPVNPRVTLTPPLNVSTVSASLEQNTARICNDSFGSDCGQYWQFAWWMGS